MRRLLWAALAVPVLCLAGCGSDTQEGARGAAGERDAAPVARAEPASPRVEVPATPPADPRPASEPVSARAAKSEIRTEPAHPLPQLPETGKRRGAPDLTVTDMHGRPISLADLRGRAVLVTFWATWCGPCRQEIPHLVRWQEAYGPQGLTILGVSLDQQGLPAVRKFVRDHPEIRYTIIPNGARAAEAFGGVERIPTAFLLDRRGRIVARFEGLPRGEEMEGFIQAVLQES